MRVKTIAVDESKEGQRLDNFLMSLFRKVPKSRIYKAIRKGEVRVNKGRVGAKYRLVKGDCVRVPPLYVPDKEPVMQASAQVRDWLASLIVFEDNALIVMNKPPGISVHAGSGQKYGVQEVLRQMRPEAECVELVHRLDKDTSGCLILAKTRRRLLLLQEQFRLRRVGKEYLALIKGEWQGGDRRVDAPLLKQTLDSGERRVRVCDKQGKSAVSIFRPLRVFSGVSLVAVRIETGRMHQIRVHARYIGHSIVGDSKYGDCVLNEKLSKDGVVRMFLHSQSLSFPQLADAMSFYAVSVLLPPDFKEFLEKSV